MKSSAVGPRIAFAALVALALVSRARAQDPDEPAHDGKWLYTRNCSGCHNDNGDGRGATILQLGLTARDFKQGGFAFGDTREQMIRTVSTGIPGRSPMPSFKGVLSDDELGLVVDYVRTLMPPRKDEKPKNTIMIVRDKPVIARGKLPPIAEGAKEVPRGLLIGTPQGMTFEYDLDGVKLLGVRLGAFADREDWHDRGGGYLKPLGNLAWKPSETDMQVRLSFPFNSPELERVLRSTHSSAASVGLTYVFRRRGTMQELATVDELVRTIATSFGPAFERTWNCRTRADSEPEIAPELEFHFDTRPVVVPDTKAAWHVHELDDGATDVVRIETRESIGIVSLESEKFLRATCVRVPKWSDEVGAKLAKELTK